MDKIFVVMSEILSRVARPAGLFIIAMFFTKSAVAEPLKLVCQPVEMRMFNRLDDGIYSPLDDDVKSLSKTMIVVDLDKRTIDFTPKRLGWVPRYQNFINDLKFVLEIYDQDNEKNVRVLTIQRDTGEYSDYIKSIYQGASEYRGRCTKLEQRF